MSWDNKSNFCSKFFKCFLFFGKFWVVYQELLSPPKKQKLEYKFNLRKFTSTYYRKTKGFFFLALTCLLSLHSNPSLPVVCPLTDMQKTTWRVHCFSQYMLAMQFWPWNFCVPHIPICNMARTVLPCWELYFGLALSGSYVRVQDLTLKKVSYVMSYLLLFSLQ